MTKRVTIYLKTNSGAKPYRTGYFSGQEYERLMKDYTQYRQYGEPQMRTYIEDVSGNDEHTVVIEFSHRSLKSEQISESEIAKIPATLKWQEDDLVIQFSR